MAVLDPLLLHTRFTCCSTLLLLLLLLPCHAHSPRAGIEKLRRKTEIVPLNERGRNFGKTFAAEAASRLERKPSEQSGQGGQSGRGPFKIIMNLFKLLYGARSNKKTIYNSDGQRQSLHLARRDNLALACGLRQFGTGCSIPTSTQTAGGREARAEAEAGSGH